MQFDRVGRVHGGQGEAEINRLGPLSRKNELAERGSLGQFKEKKVYEL